jgi:pimeloyl-ACP methyl ester carboxylesterase
MKYKWNEFNSIIIIRVSSVIKNYHLFLLFSGFKNYRRNLRTNNMKKIVFFVIALFYAINLFAQTDPAVTESPVTVKMLAGTLSGTLAIPKNATGKIPVVLIIPGYGPIDRDGNSERLNLAGNTYKLLAAALGKSGIASLRYDKRLVGQTITSTKESTFHFDDSVDDAFSLINFLSSDTRFSKVIVLGHDEGSLVGIIASDNEGVNAFISVEGAGVPANEMLSKRMESKPKYLGDEFKVVVDSLRKGKVDYNVDPALYYIARPSLQPYIMSWCGYDPQKEIKKLKIPVLILQGTTDLQVDVSNADKLKKGKNVMVIINNMNYVLKEAPADQQQNIATYTKPDLPVKPELVAAITDFVKKLK